MRVGVFGGTFDPIHLGHLIIASELRHALGLNEVRFVPAGDPPHKPDRQITAATDRVNMIELAIAGYRGFSLDPIDLERSGPSYTKDLLAALKDREPDVQFVFLMGADSLRDLPAWKDPNRILELAEIGVATRPGVTIDWAMLSSAIPLIRERVTMVEVPLIDLSSREIRLRRAVNRPITFHVPHAVERYIEANGLYREL